MDEFFAQLIASAAEARASREKTRKAQPPGPLRRPSPQTVPPGSATAPPTPRTAGGLAGPQPRQERPQPTLVPTAAARAATVVSAIEAVDPFAAVAAAVQSTVPSASSLLAAFSSREGLLAGIVLSETLAPPLALRRERDR